MKNWEDLDFNKNTFVDVLSPVGWAALALLQSC